MLRLLFLFAGLAIASAQQASKLKLTNARFADGKYWIGPANGHGHLLPRYAIDGKINGFGPRQMRGFAHSSRYGNTDRYTFYANIAGGNFKVNKVIIHPRKDCCHNRYSSMQVFTKNGNTIQKCTPKTKFTTAYVKQSMSRGLEWKCPATADANMLMVKNNVHTQIMEISAYGYKGKICKCENGVAAGLSECSADGATQCKSCASTHVLTDGKCTQKPKCTCENGVGAVWPFCRVNNSEWCTHCNDGYYQDGRVCKSKPKCNCENGLPATHPNCQKDGAYKCHSCHAGYNIKDGKCNKIKICKCLFGEPADYDDCRAHGNLQCKSCEVGYNLNDAGFCTKNLCKCENGASASGKDCPSNGGNKCLLCLKGFRLVEGKCVSMIPVVDLCKEFPKVETCTLSNAKFADNKHYKGGPWDLQAKYAIDGVIISKNKGTSFAHSATRGGKFLVNVSKNSKVHSVTIYPRRDCCFERYSSMTVTLSNSLLKIAPEYCIPPKMDSVTVRSSLNTGLKFVCSGNYAADTIEVGNKDWLQIAEIKADC